MRSFRLPKRSAARGFTLVELLVSLAAGLVISVAVVGLARSATETFHEEVRTSNTELSLRTATERIRFDLSRAGFMSTPNIRTDPTVGKVRGQTDITAPGTLQNGLGRLTSIAYESNGSNVAQVATLSNPATNPVSPDAIRLSGNFTTADEYIVQSIAPSTGGGCGGQTITLSRESAAVSRLLLNPDGTPKTAGADAAALVAAFQPVTGAGVQFMGRVMDDTGYAQYFALCPGTSTNMGAGVSPEIYIAPETPVLSASQTGGAGGVMGFGVGRMTVNPIQTVRWSIRRIADTRLDVIDPATGTWDDRKFDLVREWVDAQGQAIPTGFERIAEYAVDLEIAFSVNMVVGGQVNFPFGDVRNTTYGEAVNPPPAPANPLTRPEDIRAVRFRLAVRTAQADRTQALAAPAGGYMYRYCLTPGGCGTTMPYARVRTVVTEVSLPNQTRLPGAL